MTGACPARVLVVDDDLDVLRTYTRVLRAHGLEITAAARGAAARDTLEHEAFDAVLSDIVMPDVGGLDILQSARVRDPDLPVVLMTGSGELETAMTALERGAFRYLLKPVASELLMATVDEAIRVHRIAQATRHASELYGRAARRDVELRTELDRAIEAIAMAYQPIVRWSTRSVPAYEALVRTTTPCMQQPDRLFAAAEQLDRVAELGRRIRDGVAAMVPQLPANAAMFVNIHPRELADDRLYARDAPLSRVARRVVLELTERQSLDTIPELSARIGALRRLGFRIAVDDLGSGYSGMAAFARLQPDVVKLDMSLVRGVDADPARAAIVRSLVRLGGELGIEVVAEGVETVGERDALVELGADLLQGFLFGRPAAALAVPDLG